MPIYEYECNLCGHRIEAIQKFSDAPLTDCPQCDEASLKKLISAAAFHLKGGGWYVTDFRDKGKKKGGESKDSGSSGGSGSSDTSKAKSGD